MEKYGTIPPRFTKAWWAHYFYYYKFHALAVAFLIFMVSSIIYSNVTRVHYDLQVSYMGLFGINPDHEESLSNYFETAIEDVTGNGKKEIGYMYYTVDNVMEDGALSEDEYAFQMKFAAELQGGESDLYITTGTNADDLIGYSANFMSVYDFAGDNLPEERIKRNVDGHPYAVSVAGNEALEAMGIDTSDLYVSVRLLFEMNEDDPKKVRIHQNSVKAAEKLVGE